MKIPRLTTRRLMMLVALAAVVLGVAAWMEQRKRRFLRLSVKHQMQGNLPMALKYAAAARYPWLPVEPDPPEPE